MYTYMTNLLLQLSQEIYSVNLDRNPDDAVAFSLHAITGMNPSLYPLAMIK